MSRFVQLHILTSYPPSNMNRDDQGRPKTAKMGGTDRLRVSSQSLKRTWRVSDLFIDRITQGADHTVFNVSVPANLSKRSRTFSGEWVKPFLQKQGVAEDDADAWSKDLCRAFGQMENDKNKLSQVAAVTDTELLGFHKLVDQVRDFLVDKKSTNFTDKMVGLIETRDKKKKSDDIKKANQAITKFVADECLGSGTTAVDIALFGRMLASTPKYNIEAACQVAHAISVHPVTIEDDYFTAVDDLNTGNDDAGAAHIGEAGFAAGVFYSYICINKELLIENLNGNKELASKAIAALTEAAVTVAPKGKQNSFAHPTYAFYALAEKGDRQPRSLCVSFLKPVPKYAENYATEALDALENQRSNFDKVYGPCADARYVMNSITAEGTLQELLTFVSE